MKARTCDGVLSIVLTVTPALIVLAILTGCTSAPRAAQPDLDVTLPAQWTAGAGGTSGIAPGWWTDFHDSQLDELVAVALRRNHDLRAAVARVDSAWAEAKIAGADLQPNVGLGFNATRQRQNFIGLPIPGDEGGVLSTTFTTYGVSLDTTWEIDLWGRLRAQSRAALADFQAAAADLYGVSISLAGQTVKAYFAAVEANQQRALAQTTVTSFEASAAKVASRYQRGLRSSLDLRLALSNLADAKALLEQRKQQQDAALRQLEILLGRYPGHDLAVPIELPPLPGPIPAGIPADLVSRRPDLVAAERRLAAVDSRLAAARAALYPSISLTASGGTASQDLEDLLDFDFRVWSLVGNLTQPLFQGGRLRANVDRARATRDEAVERYASDALKAFSEVESALAAEEFLSARKISLEEAARQAKAAWELAEDRYRSGLEDYVTVLEAQRRSLNSTSGLLTIERLRLDNRVDLYLALGGGFRHLPARAGEVSTDGGSITIEHGNS